MYNLQYINGHIFIEVDGELWLFDTGAPTSFGSSSVVILARVKSRIDSTYMGLTPTALSEYVSIECVGLLGADVLGQYDFIIDVPSGTIEVSVEELGYTGEALPMDEFMGIPIVSARIRGQGYRMFFDTGAQISYFQHDSLADFPSAGTVTDFYPGAGQFQTETHNVDISLGNNEFVLRCGSLPGLLGMTFMMASTDGIIGNQVITNRRCGYFPRRRLLVL